MSSAYQCIGDLSPAKAPRGFHITTLSVLSLFAFPRFPQNCDDLKWEIKALIFSNETKEIGRSTLLAWVRDHSLLLRCKGAHRLLRVHPSGVKRNSIRCLSLALSKDCPVKGASDRTGTGRSLAIQVHADNQEAKGLFRKRLYWRLLTNKWGSNTQFNDSKKIVTDQYYSRCQGDSSE